MACLDYTLILDIMDVRIKDEFYRLRFQVEGVLKQPNGETDMTEAHKEDDRDDDQYNDENDKSAKDDKEPKRSKNDVSSVAEPEKKGGESVPLLPGK
jgi:hypothetical protein